MDSPMCRYPMQWVAPPGKVEVQVEGKVGSESLTPALGTSVRPLVLVVDDDENFARACVRMLEGWGYGVETASDGGSALELAKNNHFDVVLTDINIPQYSGLDLLRAVRERDRDVPVVLVTGGPGLDSARVAVEFGALSYLIKPLSSGELRDVLSRAVQMHRVA